MKSIPFAFFPLMHRKTMLLISAAKSLQSCLTLWDPIDSSPPSSPVPGILQARTLEWVSISFSNAWKWKVKVESLSRVQLFATPWTAAHQAPLSIRFSRQEYWSGVPLPSPEPNWLVSNKSKNVPEEASVCFWLKTDCISYICNNSRGVDPGTVGKICDGTDSSLFSQLTI